jgi:hypothetical protein
LALRITTTINAPGRLEFTSSTSFAVGERSTLQSNMSSITKINNGVTNKRDRILKVEAA